MNRQRGSKNRGRGGLSRGAISLAYQSFSATNNARKRRQEDDPGGEPPEKRQVPHAAVGPELWSHEECHEDEEHGSNCDGGPTCDAASGMLHWRFHELETEEIYSEPRETHYVLPYSKTGAYHTGHRKFLVVGLPLVICQGSHEVLVGWCNSARGCCGHDPTTRETFPGTDFPNCPPHALGENNICLVGKKVVERLGGEEIVKLLLRQAMNVSGSSDDCQAPVLHQMRKRSMGSYVAVNANSKDLPIFPGWGIVKIEQEKVRCLTCRTMPMLHI